MDATKVIKRESKYKGYLKVEALTIVTARGHEINREILRKQNAVAALVYDTVRDKYIFARQWRPGPEGPMTEICAGVLDHHGESREQCVRREIEEELGYRVDDLSFISEGFVSPGYTTEMISVYFARVSHRTGTGGGVACENEEIEIVEMTRDEMLDATFNDLKSIIAVQWARYNTPREIRP